MKTLRYAGGAANAKPVASHAPEARRGRRASMAPLTARGLRPTIRTMETARVPANLGARVASCAFF